MLDLNKLHTEWYGWTMQGGRSQNSEETVA